MVGRKMELAQLRQAFEWTGRRRTAYLTTVLGAAGIGKTRLALEFGGGLREEATVLAEALSQQGKDGAAERAAAQAMDLSHGDDRFTRILARTALARVHAHQGQLAETEALAREAVERSLQTDWADQQADALTALAEVVRLAGREQAASETLGLALERYEQRENIVAARRVRGLLATT